MLRNHRLTTIILSCLISFATFAHQKQGADVRLISESFALTQNAQTQTLPLALYFGHPGEALIEFAAGSGITLQSPEVTTLPVAEHGPHIIPVEISSHTPSNAYINVAVTLTTHNGVSSSRVFSVKLIGETAAVAQKLSNYPKTVVLPAVETVTQN